VTPPPEYMKCDEPSNKRHTRKVSCSNNNNRSSSNNNHLPHNIGFLIFGRSCLPFINRLVSFQMGGRGRWHWLVKKCLNWKILLTFKLTWFCESLFPPVFFSPTKSLKVYYSRFVLFFHKTIKEKKCLPNPHQFTL
jgi:hypothetical protein